MLQIHRAERADGLADALAELLAEPPADPFAVEVVAVPARGMERWLTQQLSARLGARPERRDGICAGVTFPSPAELIEGAVACATGVSPDADPWRPERLVWPLLDVVESSLGEPWLRTLATYLGHNGDPARSARRLSTVRHLARLFWRYALHRPEMVGAWAQGSRVPGEAGSSAVWQAELWRRLLAVMNSPDPAARVAAACRALEREPELLALPGRISLFGLTRTPAAHLQVLRALAARREVHMFLPHPSPVLWDRMPVDGRGGGGGGGGAILRSADPTGELPENPLLRSWGRDARELQELIAASGPFADRHHPAGCRGETLLRRIQDGVRADRAPPGAPLPGQAERRAALGEGDSSLRVHACHGRARQVEVVRGAILHALAADETLEPRDVIVMCPDVETFAPLVAASFGGGGDEPARIDLRVRLADRSLRQTNPVLGVVAQLLELAGRRLTASEVLDLAGREPVRNRFHLDDSDLARVQGWVADAGIRWGLDAADRAPYKLDAVNAGTWRAGLDRVLLGVAMSEDGQRLFGHVLPLDDVDGGSIDLAGRLAELVDRLGQALRALRTPQAVSGWTRSIAHAADLLTRTAAAENWQRAQLERLLADLAGEAQGSRASLELAEVRALLAERLQGRPTRANFRTGHLTVCTLVPMRSVPHRVVCLLGLDDGAFPRKAPRDGDDVMLDQPRVGERDPRSEDRQLLLDALMAAGEQLIVTYTGNDERTNVTQPSAVPVGELLDVVDATVTARDGPARSRVLVRHPLQPFDPRNFAAGALVSSTSWSFDRTMLAGARALALGSPRGAREPFLAGPLPGLADGAYELSELLRFAQHPVRAFLRRRLGISLAGRSEEVQDALEGELDGLQRWAVGQRLLDARLAGVERRTAALAEIARGTLPPGVLGQPVIRAIEPIVDAIAAASSQLAGGRGEAVDVRLSLPGKRTLTGTVPGVCGETLLSSTFSRLGAKHRLAAWARLLALTLADPSCALCAVSVGRDRSDGVAACRIKPLGEDAGQRRRMAEEKLLALLDLYDRGMREPLPIFCSTSAAYAAAIVEQTNPVAAARKEWRSEWNFDHEDREPEHRLVLGGELTLEEVMLAPPAPEEHGAGWDPSESSRFGRLAQRMWDGLLELESPA